MPRLEYFLVCESISTDQETNRVSLFNVIDELQIIPDDTAPHRPLITHLVAVSCWNREPGDEGQEFQAILRIHTSGREPIDFAMNFQMERPRQRLALHIQGIPKMESDELKFELLLNGSHVAWHTVNVVCSTSEAPIAADD